MRFFLATSLFLLFSIFSAKVFAQGCSDAGVCSAGSLALVAQFKFDLLPLDETKLLPLPEIDPGLGNSNDSKNHKDSSLSIQVATSTRVVSSDSAGKKVTKELEYSYQFPKYSFQYSFSYAVGDRSTNVFTDQLEANMMIVDKKLFAQVKVPYTSIRGELAKIHGLSDITISLSYIAFIKKKSILSFTGGVKLPANNANRSKDNLPLPMVYQTSLGSTDVLLGVKYGLKKWDLTVGYQHAFNENKNNYLQDTISETNYNAYFESKSLKRADDAILRISRNIYYKKLNVNAGLLFIYHLENDKYTNAMGERAEAKNSQGLTLNINLSGVVSINKKLDFLAVFASPVVTRENRPDGLTRKFVSMVGVKYNIY